MKDYTLPHEKKEKFILNYQIENNKIIINYANQTQTTIEYSESTEKLLLQIMKEQVLNRGFYYKIIQLSIKCNEMKSKCFAVMGGLGIGGIICSDLMFEYILSGLIAILGVGNMLHLIMRHYEIDEVKNDFEKNKFFIENEQIFQELDKCNGIFIDTKKEIKDFIKEIRTKNFNSEIISPNINDIDKLSYNTIVEIYELIQKNKELSKYYEDSQSNYKKVLTKK